MDGAMLAALTPVPQRAGEVHEQLELTMMNCRHERRYLQRAHEHVKANIGILQKHRRKAVLVNIYKILQEVAVLRTAKTHLMDLLGKQQFKPAIEVGGSCFMARAHGAQLWTACNEIVGSWSQLQCISEIVANFGDTSQLIETHLNKSFASLCESITLGSYINLFEAYKMIGPHASSRCTRADSGQA